MQIDTIWRKSAAKFPDSNRIIVEPEWVFANTLNRTIVPQMRVNQYYISLCLVLHVVTPKPYLQIRKAVSWSMNIRHDP